MLGDEKWAFEVDFVGFVPDPFIGIEHISEIGIRGRVVNQNVQPAEDVFNFFK